MESHTLKHVIKLIMMLITNNHSQAMTIIPQLLHKNESLLKMKSQCGITLLHKVSIHNRASLVELFLEHGAHINALDKDQRTPLYYACKCDSFDTAKLLLERGAKVCVPNSRHRTALHWAAKHRNLELTRMLLERGAKTNYPMASQCASTPFHMSFRRGNLEMTQLFMRHGADVNQKNGAGENAIHLAVRAGMLEIVEMLLVEAGLNPNEVTRTGMVPLHFAILSRADTDRVLQVIDLLLIHGAQVDLADEQGKTPLYLAVKLQKRQEAMRLLDRGADVNGISGSLRSRTTMPLFAALAKSDEGLTKLLLNRGARAEGRDADGNGALHLAFRGNLEKNIEREDLLEVYITLGAQVNERNLKGQTPLHMAITRPSYLLEECGILLNHGADPNLQDLRGNSAMGLAIEQRPVDYLSLFLRRGGNPNERAPNGGRSLLYKALINRDVEKVALLLEHGAECDDPTSIATYVAVHSSVPVMKLLLDRDIVRDINAKDHTGRTPIEAAVANRQQIDMVHYLLQKNPIVVDRVTGHAKVLVEAVELYDQDRSSISNDIVCLVLKHVAFVLDRFNVPLHQEESQLIGEGRDWQPMYQSFLDEIKTMRDTRVKSVPVTYLELFAKRHNALVKYLRYEAVIQDLARTLSLQSFPHYGSGLRLNCNVGMRRLQLIDTMREFLQETLLELRLPYEVMEKIAEVMSTKDLEASLILANRCPEEQFPNKLLIYEIMSLITRILLS